MALVSCQSKVHRSPSPFAMPHSASLGLTLRWSWHELVCRPRYHLLKVRLMACAGPELLNQFVGESERAVRQVFQRSVANSTLPPRLYHTHTHTHVLECTCNTPNKPKPNYKPWTKRMIYMSHTQTRKPSNDSPRKGNAPGLLVAAITNTCLRSFKPSISVSSWFTTLSLTTLP